MTVEEFTQKTVEKNRSRIILEALLVVLIIAIGLILIYKLHYTNWFERSKPTASATKVWAYTVGVGIILFGASCLIKILKTYRIITIQTSLSSDENFELLEGVARKLNWAFINDSSWIEYHGATNWFFGYSYDIRVLIEDQKIHFDIQTTSFGIIDFGDRRRLIKKLKHEITRDQHVV